MSRRTRSLNRQWGEFLCRLMGHDWVDGYKFKSAKSEGCSKVCSRCGFYENTIIHPVTELIPPSSKTTSH